MIPQLSARPSSPWRSGSAMHRRRSPRALCLPMPPVSPLAPSNTWHRDMRWRYACRRLWRCNVLMARDIRVARPRTLLNVTRAPGCAWLRACCPGTRPQRPRLLMPQARVQATSHPTCRLSRWARRLRTATPRTMRVISAHASFKRHQYSKMNTAADAMTR